MRERGEGASGGKGLIMWMKVAFAIVAVLGLGVGCGPRQFVRSSTAGEQRSGFESVPDGGVAEEQGGGHVIVSGDDDEAWGDVEIGADEDWSDNSDH